MEYFTYPLPSLSLSLALSVCAWIFQDVAYLPYHPITNITPQGRKWLKRENYD